MARKFEVYKRRHFRKFQERETVLINLNLGINKKLQGIISYFGPKAQKEKLIEELKELAEALEETDSLKSNHILEEMADVSIMLNQYALILRNYDILYDKAQDSDIKFKNWVDYKLKRTIQRIEQNKGGYCKFKDDCDSVVGEERDEVFKNE